MSITRLVYFSENQIDTQNVSLIKELSGILSASNQNNRAHNISGALVFDDMWFLQTLEGDRDAVWKTYERIKSDRRHAGVVLVEVAEVEARIFGNWWMGLARRDDGTKHAFKPYLYNGDLKPESMTARQILALMVDLARIGFSRVIAAKAA